MHSMMRSNRGRRHIRLLIQAILVWFAFWLAGMPDYYQQYATVTMAVACVLLSVAISLAAILVLRGGDAVSRQRRARWLAFYYSVPFALLDWIYCGWFLGHGHGFIVSYWYLSVFYVTPWLTFPPTAALLSRVVPSSADAGRANA